ncbi:class I SAM-dependent DNA methyltransferase [Rhizobium paknamense]|uniref:TPR repeat methyltransferase n=1 Tax=Rhizobium paknamense TaxID=1206817 RepID=A0ABU0IHN7_9HYPH|nr:methyltransferase domain-containing protein [Rhizobium paknamense]MDQ0456905.1 putative TPR repeat methyltransferase [Rhizobium paknamense]
MLPLSLSSGDVTADRRADYARMLGEGGDFAAAAELMEQALELAPGWAAGWFQLGEYRLKAGAADKAVEAYRAVRALDPEDMFAASLKLALIGAEAVPEQPPSRYVEALFDDYADRFETSLVEKLHYQVPQRLAALIARVAGQGHLFQTAIDLGCGTGLMGVELAGKVGLLEGYDLSGGMLAKAAEKQLYHHLGEADLSLDAAACGLFDGRETLRADLVTAADVLMYLGNLSGVFALTATLLKPGGHFAFSVEKQAESQGFTLAPSLRYQHSFAYVTATLAQSGFTLLESEEATIRMDGGKPVLGMLFIAAKSR